MMKFYKQMNSFLSTAFFSLVVSGKFSRHASRTSISGHQPTVTMTTIIITVWAVAIAAVPALLTVAAMKWREIHIHVSGLDVLLARISVTIGYILNSTKSGPGTA